RKARKSEPIIVPPLSKRSDEDTLAPRAALKFNVPFTIFNILETRPVDNLYKLLRCIKLVKELRRDLFPTEEERAFLKKASTIMNGMTPQPQKTNDTASQTKPVTLESIIDK
ncbi:MAG: hypothetical protein ACXACA_06500, partial [Candidatus Ranarchaeia archaeon]